MSPQSNFVGTTEMASDINSGTEVPRFPCETCGADFRFDPDATQLVCDHCGNTAPLVQTDVQSSGLREIDVDAALSDLLPKESFQDITIAQCESCAAQVEFVANLIS